MTPATAADSGPTRVRSLRPRGLGAPIFRLALGLSCVAVSLVITADLVLGAMAGQGREIHQYRRALATALAVEYSSLTAHGAVDVIRVSMHEIVERNPDLRSAALRTAAGDVVVSAGDHARAWVAPPGDESTLDDMQVPIFAGPRRWGTLELAFKSRSTGWHGLFDDPLVRMVTFVGLTGYIAFFAFLRRSLRALDPSRVVPERVTTTLNVLAEGVLLLDDAGRIVLVNSAATERLDRPPSAMLGRRASDLGWRLADRTPDSMLPWVRAQADGRPVNGVVLELPVGPHGSRRFVVNSAPICDDSGAVRGVAATFDDVTDLERTNASLRELTEELETAREEVERQNAELSRLAMRDPLTGVFNRRALFEHVEALWTTRTDAAAVVGCIMADIDRFKSFNDRFGHTVGDDVIKAVARELGATLRVTDVLGRYGGEEFCILLPALDERTTAELARRLCQAVEAKAGPGVRSARGLRVTVSLGVAACKPGGTLGPAQLIDRADQALVAAKRMGRNRVVCWSEMNGVLAPVDSPTTADRP